MITTTFVTRYVADHAAGEAWYADFFGRPCDRSPMPNCREWQLTESVVFQVIQLPERAGELSCGFVVDDLDGAVARLEADGITQSDAFDVQGFDGLRYCEFTDPEGVTTGLLNTGAA